MVQLHQSRGGCAGGREGVKFLGVSSHLAVTISFAGAPCTLQRIGPAASQYFLDAERYSGSFCDNFKHSLVASPNPAERAEEIRHSTLRIVFEDISYHSLIHHSLIIPVDVRLFPSGTKLA